MKRYFVSSVAIHTLFFTALVAYATFLAKPRQAYYAVDLMSAMPSGASAPAPVAAPEPQTKPVPAPPKPVVKETPPPKDAIKMPTREKPKPKPTPPAAKAKPEPAKPKRSAAFDAAMRALEQEGPSGMKGEGRTTVGTAGATGAGVVGEAGPAFPYPWYLKQVADRLDRNWHPQQEFDSDMLCQITFSIRRDGQVGTATIEKRSGDSVFDELALRAVLNSNPMPPLPSGFTEETLRVHMKFVGKQ